MPRRPKRTVEEAVRILCNMEWSRVVDERAPEEQSCPYCFGIGNRNDDGLIVDGHIPGCALNRYAHPRTAK